MYNLLFVMIIHTELLPLTINIIQNNISLIFIAFSHPNIEFLYGEIVYSPYNVNPRKNYPKGKVDLFILN